MLAYNFGNEMSRRARKKRDKSIDSNLKRGTALHCDLHDASDLSTLVSSARGKDMLVEAAKRIARGIPFRDRRDKKRLAEAVESGAASEVASRFHWNGEWGFGEEAEFKAIRRRNKGASLRRIMSLAIKSPMMQQKTPTAHRRRSSSGEFLNDYNIRPQLLQMAEDAYIEASIR